MQYDEIYYPKDVTCVCISPLPLQCNVEVCLETTVAGHNKKPQQLGVIETGSPQSKEQKQGKVC